MIVVLLTAFLNFIILFCKAILLPINTLIEQFLPDLSNMLSSVQPLFDTASQYLNWVISLSGLSTTAIQFIVLYFTFKLTVPLSVYVIKFVVKWYNALVP